MIYVDVALIAARTAAEENKSPKEAWPAAVEKVYPHSKESQKQACPSNAFLGLCSEGKIKGIKERNYTNSEDNKLYALAVVKILESGLTKHLRL